MDIVLASESKYKKKLLLRILDEFNQIAPHINETPNPGESAPDLAIRLALQKGVTLLENNSDSIIISSDQVAEINGELILKPSSKQQATEQLKKQSGNKVIFYTCLCVTKFGPKKGLKNIPFQKPLEKESCPKFAFTSSKVKIFLGGQIFFIFSFQIFKLKYFLKGSSKNFNSNE